MKHIIKKNKDVYGLMLGTAFAQGLLFLFSPILSRLYTPSDYALLGIMLSSSNIFAEFCSLKYERTIVLEEEKESAINLFFLSALLTLFVSVISLFTFSLFKTNIEGLGIHSSLSVLIYIIPPMILAMGIVTASNFWFQRIKEYYRMTTNKIIQMVGITLFTVLLGYLKVTNGLIIGYLLGWIGVLIFSLYQLNNNGTVFQQFSLTKIILVLKKYSSFPKYNLVPSVLNVIAIALPFYLVTYIYGEESGGLFNMCKQLLMLPTSFISVAFAQIYYRKFAEAIANKKKIAPILNSMLKPILLIGLTMLITLVFFGDVLFEVVLGKTWSVSGKIAMTYSFATFSQFIGITLMIILPTINQVKQESIFKIFYFIAICILFMIKFSSLSEFILSYTIVETILYSIISIYCIVMVYKNDRINA